MRPAAPVAARFALLALAWSLAFFALLRSAWVERRLLLPLTEFQGAIATWYGGVPALPVVVSLECSAADAIALLLGATLAYPASWRGRLAAAGGGVLLVLAVNTVRIGTLALAAGSPHLFESLHLVVWPVLLVLVSAGYALAWMLGARPALAGQPAAAAARGLALPCGQFATLGVALLLLSAGATPWVAESRLVLQAAAWMAGTAARLLGAVGVAVTVSGTVLSTGHGAFLVTQECVLTPLIPVYLAAALTLPRGWAQRALAFLAAVPLFVTLGILRILLVALPPALVTSPVMVVHGFYQLLLGALAVGAVALWHAADGRGARPLGRAIAACLVGLLLAWVGGGAYTRLIAGAVDILRWALVEASTTGAALADRQGALRMLPAYQLALLPALWLAARPGVPGRRLAWGLGLLAAAQVLLGVAADLAHRRGAPVHPVLIRAWAVAGPLLALALLQRDGPRPLGGRGGAPPPGAPGTAPGTAPV
jgi:exosortase/archaeosortase family protein